VQHVVHAQTRLAKAPAHTLAAPQTSSQTPQTSSRPKLAGAAAVAAALCHIAATATGGPPVCLQLAVDVLHGAATRCVRSQAHSVGRLLAWPLPASALSRLRLAHRLAVGPPHTCSMLNDGMWPADVSSVVLGGALLCGAERLVRNFQHPANKLADAATQFADTYTAVAQRPGLLRLGAGISQPRLCPSCVEQVKKKGLCQDCVKQK
jgi:hypothetical protein